MNREQAWEAWVKEYGSGHIYSFDAGWDAALTVAAELAAALEMLLRNLSTVEVLGEWEALDMNRHLRVTERAKVDAIRESARAALHHYRATQEAPAS